MFTGTGDETTAVELMKSGLDDYVVKHARQLPRLRASMKLAVENARQRSKLSEREQQLTVALAHKDIIVRELHHRVKNNLQTIIALLNLRARMKGGEIAEHLNELAGRMKALGHVQARLYESQALDCVDFTRTLGDIARELVKVYGQQRIRLRLDLSEPVHLDVGRAMPLALLCYEILLNSMKHAWADGREGTLSVQLEKRDGGTELIIADDGVGFDQHSISRGFGSTLTSALAREANVQRSTSSSHGAGSRTIIRLP
jgi:two-component sensor histidine kinase